MRHLLFASLLLAAPAFGTDVYRWVDADGQHFSDQWRPGAEKIRLEDAATVTASKAPASGPAGAPAPKGKPPASSGAYEALEISSPAQEEVLWNIAGQLHVSVQLNPSLRPGDGLRLFLDGEQQGVPPGATEVTLTNVFRGVHTLKAEVVDLKGKVLAESQPTTFVVRQTSISTP